jgi:putative flippase GtrA
MSLHLKAKQFFAEHLFVRYVVVGLFNTLAGYLLYVLFLLLGFEYKLANLFALIVGICISFKTQGKFVFQNPDNTLIFKYIACWALIYFVNIFFIGQFIALGFSQYAAGALATPIAVLLSFGIQKYLIFRKA